MSGSWNKRYWAIPKATQEIVIEDFAPTLDIHKPAGKFPKVQKRRWKTWYHVDNKYNPTTVLGTYVRSWIRNEWTPMPWWSTMRIWPATEASIPPYVWAWFWVGTEQLDYLTNTQAVYWLLPNPAERWANAIVWYKNISPLPLEVLSYLWSGTTRTWFEPTVSLWNQWRTLASWESMLWISDGTQWYALASDRVESPFINVNITDASAALTSLTPNTTTVNITATSATKQVRLPTLISWIPEYPNRIEWRKITIFNASTIPHIVRNVNPNSNRISIQEIAPRAVMEFTLVWSNLRVLSSHVTSAYYEKTLTANVTITWNVMTAVAWLTIPVVSWRKYKLVIRPFYDVNATTEWIWMAFSATPLLNDYSFEWKFSNDAQSSYFRNYASQTQNFATAQTSRLTNNRAEIVVEFTAWASWNLIPAFRAETATGVLTLKAWTRIEVTLKL